MIPLLTWRTCLGFQSDGNGLPFGNNAISTYITRLISISKPCPDGSPCHIYTTLAEDGATSLFVNLQTSTNVQSLTLSYDALAYYNQTQTLRYAMNSSAFELPSLEAKGERNIHSLLLYNLSANTMYFAQAFYDNTIQANFTFKTLPNATDPSNLTIISGGDIGYSEASRK